MKRSPESKALWRLFTPLLAYWVVKLVVDFLQTCVMMIVKAEEIAPLMNYNLQTVTDEEMREMTAALSEIVQEFYLQYQLECTVALAVCMIVVMGIMFWNDRKKEAEKRAEKQAAVVSSAAVDGTPANTVPTGAAAANSVPAGRYVLIVGLGVVFCLVGNCLAGMSGLVYSDQAYQETAAVFYGASFVMQIVGSGIIIPLSEELFYRGLVFKRFREQGSFWLAAAVSTLLFSGGHGNLVQGLYTIGLGVLLAFVYERYGSLKAPLCLHITANIVSLCCTQFGVFDWLMANKMWMAVLAVAGTFVGAVIVVSLWERGDMKNGSDETGKES